MLTGKQMKKYFTGLVCPAFFVILILSSKFTMAQGDLMIFPKRIVFDGSKRTQELNLANSGKDTARYLLTLVQIRMKEDGTFETITEPDPGQNFADKYLRIFPRNVVLPPNEAQTVKVQLTNSGELQPGEYRSHLYIRAEAEKRPLGEEETPVDTKSISVKLVAIFGISIPIIIRSGESTSSVSLSDVSFQPATDKKPVVKFTFNRSGNMSVYGDVAVNYVSPEGKIIPVASAKGLALYTPTTIRHVNLELMDVPGVDYHKGSLKVSYSYDAAKDKKLAEESIVLR